MGGKSYPFLFLTQGGSTLSGNQVFGVSSFPKVFSIEPHQSAGYKTAQPGGSTSDVLPRQGLGSKWFCTCWQGWDVGRGSAGQPHKLSLPSLMVNCFNCSHESWLCWGSRRSQARPMLARPVAPPAPPSWPACAVSIYWQAPGWILNLLCSW